MRRVRRSPQVCHYSDRLPITLAAAEEFEGKCFGGSCVKTKNDPHEQFEQDFYGGCSLQITLAWTSEGAGPFFPRYNWVSTGVPTSQRCRGAVSLCAFAFHLDGASPHIGVQNKGLKREKCELRSEEARGREDNPNSLFLTLKICNGDDFQHCRSTGGGWQRYGVRSSVSSISARPERESMNFRAVEGECPFMFCLSSLFEGKWTVKGERGEGEGLDRQMQKRQLCPIASRGSPTLPRELSPAQ